ncbi:MAG: chemotaxis-specific protein-glutamate methyltransferase CheB [Pseudomonadota bacterium]
MLRSARIDASAKPGKAANAIRVMLIDDSLTVRTIFKRMVESDDGMVVQDTASSAESGIAKLKTLDADAAPNVILLDLEMPGMGGLEALPTILKVAPKTQVMVVSSLTEDGAESTVQALSQGAADTMLKPRPGGFNEEYRAQLLDKIKALGKTDDSQSDRADTKSSKDDSADTGSQKWRSSAPAEILAIGASTGGIHGINVLLKALGPNFDLPIVITQHLPSSFIPVFARQIEVASGRPTHIADDGTEIRAGEIAIATGHGHMVVKRRADHFVARILAEPAKSGCLPSVDPMLSSLAKTCEGRVLAIILSGMGRDGLDGAEELYAAGGTIWAQDAETSAVWGMPGAVAKAGIASFVAPANDLADAVMSEIVGANANAQRREAMTDTVD